MAPPSTPPLPGSMTVPPLFGWEVILTVLVLLIGVAVAFFLASVAGTAADDRSEWKSWLQARSWSDPARPDAPVQAGSAPVPARRRTTERR